ncbi:MAG: HNH endonuclease family protein [Bifidobacteriaceae bacterium]|jgi:hypothetical protein|nr:HNH endonuclease family protein [Bifidobacteriaceae bacterium]
MLNKKLKMIVMSGILALSLVFVTGCAEMDVSFNAEDKSAQYGVDVPYEEEAVPVETGVFSGDTQFIMPSEDEQYKYAGALAKIGTDVEVKDTSNATYLGRDTEYGNWRGGNDCNTRNTMINDAVSAYDMRNGAKTIKYDNKKACKVLEGTFYDFYTNKAIDFVRGTGSNQDGGVQIDHIVAVRLTFDEGASAWTETERKAYYNDPEVLIAVENRINSRKGDGYCKSKGCDINDNNIYGETEDKAYKFWVPPNINYRCEYAYRQVTVREKYGLWMLPDERDTYSMILSVCSGKENPKKLIGE